MDRRDLELQYVVALAGSAGALPVMLRQLDRLFVRDHSCLFLIYHRAPDVAFDLGARLPHDTVFSVREAQDGIPVEPNVVYYPRGANNLTVRDGVLVTSPPAARYRPNIDALLSSLAHEYAQKVVAVLLSGGGTDGVEGMRAVRARGGLSIVQDPATARHAGLPLAAIEAGAAEHVLSTGEILQLVDDTLAGRAPAKE